MKRAHSQLGISSRRATGSLKVEVAYFVSSRQADWGPWRIDDFNAAASIAANQKCAAPGRPLYAGELSEKAVGEASISFDSKRKAASWEAIAALGVVGILAAGIVFLILRYAVAIPMLDDWEMVALVTKAHTGGLTFTDLIAQQQEARPLFPKLIFIAMSF